MYKTYRKQFSKLPNDEKKLIQKAIQVRKFAYSLHGSKVGAAIQTKNGKIFTGVNVGNATSTLNVHAEVAAVVNAVSNGFQEFTKIAVVPFEKNVEGEIMQCGVCLQFLSEFSKKDFKFIVADESKSIIHYTFLKDIFPNPFRK